MRFFVLEQTLNYLINNQAIDISALNGKTLNFSLADLPLTMCFICGNDRIFVAKNADPNAAVNIRLELNVFVSLLKGANLTELLKQDKIVIHGDVKTAQLLVDLLQLIDIDLEELLSKYSGDIIAHQIGGWARRFKNSPLLAVVKDGLMCFQIHPTKPSRYKNNA